MCLIRAQPRPPFNERSDSSAEVSLYGRTSSRPVRRWNASRYFSPVFAAPPGGSSVAGVLPPEAVQGERAQGGGVGRLFADKLHGLLERDVLVVALFCLRGRGEDRLEQLLPLLEPLRELDPAEAARLAVLRPAGAPQHGVAADAALHVHPPRPAG